MGSQAFIGSARLGLFVEEHPADPQKVFVVQSKSNAGDRARTQVFSKQGGQFEWCGVTRVNKEMMAGGGKGPSPQAFLEACFWLEDRLKDGRSYPAKDLQEEMKEAGLTHGVAFTAKKALGVVHTKTSVGTFTWYLPPLLDITPATSAISSISSTSSTSYSSQNTTPYGVSTGGITSSDGEHEAPSHVVNVDDVAEVYEVDGVATDATASLPAPPPTSGGSTGVAGTRYCLRCGEETTHGIERGVLACSWCSTLPAEKVFAPSVVPDPVRCPVAGVHTRFKMGKEYRCSACNALMTPPLAQQGA
jgi:hypothetical protein